MGFPGGSDSKESACNAGYLGLNPGLGRSLGGGRGNPFQHSCLGNSMAEEPGGLQSMGVSKESDMTEWLSRHMCTSVGLLYDTRKYWERRGELC